MEIHTVSGLNSRPVRATHFSALQTIHTTPRFKPAIVLRFHQKGMDELNFEDAWLADYGHWLKPDIRCFGDKGDVEDITEGKGNLAMVLGGRTLLTVWSGSGHHIDGRIRSYWQLSSDGRQRRSSSPFREE